MGHTTLRRRNFTNEDRPKAPHVPKPEAHLHRSSVLPKHLEDLLAQREERHELHLPGMQAGQPDTALGICERKDDVHPLCGQASAEAPAEPATAPALSTAVKAVQLPSDVQFVVSWYLAHPEYIQRAVDEALAPKPVLARWEREKETLPAAVVTCLDFAQPARIKSARARRRMVVQELARLAA